MKFISLLAILSFLPVIYASSSLSAPTAAPTAINTTAASVSTSSLLVRNSSRNGGSGEEIQATSTIEENNPLITAAPTAEEIQLQEKYHLTTYWSCVTLQTFVHCGW